MRLLVLGAHSIETKTARLAAMLVDGAIALDAGSLTSGLELTEQRDIRAVLLTHHHFDHVRDLVTFGMNLSAWDGQVPVFGLVETLDTVYSTLLDGKIYVNYAEYPSSEKPSFKFVHVAPYGQFMVAGYRITPIPVRHAVPAVGYLVVAPDGRSLFYAGDTGRGFMANLTVNLSPDLLVTEVSGPDEKEDLLTRPGHLSPHWLKEELLEFRKLKGYVPKVLVGHRNLVYEAEIISQLMRVADELGAEIMIGQEGMVVEV